MPLDLTNFGLDAMLRCGLGLRRSAKAAPSLEAAAGAIVRFLHDGCRDPVTGVRSCVLVRLYLTLPFARLEPALQAFARRALVLGEGGQHRASIADAAHLAQTPPDPGMRCLTLLASAGSRPEWGDRRRSRAHQAIPLPSPRVVERAPMVAQLIRQLGLDLADVVRPSSALLGDAAGRTHNVFHVEEALGSPYIPAQAEFVVPCGVRSVLGFGGLLHDELFAVVLFSRVPIPASSADRFRTIALDAKSALHALGPVPVFGEGAAGAAGAS
jgi:hypothetical protein